MISNFDIVGGSLPDEDPDKTPAMLPIEDPCPVCKLHPLTHVIATCIAPEDVDEAERVNDCLSNGKWVFCGMKKVFQCGDTLIYLGRERRSKLPPPFDRWDGRERRLKDIRRPAK